MSFDLPQLPSGWDYKSLESCTRKGSISYGVVQPGTAISDGVPIIRVNNFRESYLDTSDLMRISPEIESRYSRTRLQGGEVLITIVGSVGQVAVTSKKHAGFNVARAVAVIHPENIEPEWISICLQSPLSNFLLVSRANTTVQTTINLKDLRNLPIPIPPKDEREAITKLLVAIDNRITLLRETNTTLEAIAQALFKSWFVDFDPVHAKQQGRTPEGMDAQTAALFPDSFEESELGMVPKGWRVGTLGDIAQTIKKQISSEQLHSGLNYVGLEHIPRKSLSLAAWDNAEGLESSKAKFGVGDVLFGKLRPYFHKVVIAPVDGVCSTDILVCGPKKSAYYGLVAMQLFSKELIDYADRLSNGAKMPRVNWSDLAAYPIAIPSEEIANSYTKFSKEIFEKMQQGVHQMQTLAKLRDTLLPRLISGQLRLPEAQALVEDAVDS